MGNLSAGAFLVALSGIVIVFIMLAVLCFMTSGFLVLWILGVRHARRRHPQRS